LAHPAWGYRKIWAMVRHDSHVVSEATVLRTWCGHGVFTHNLVKIAALTN
jgi:hypothetical protein